MRSSIPNLDLSTSNENKVFTDTLVGDISNNIDQTGTGGYIKSNYFTVAEPGAFINFSNATLNLDNTVVSGLNSISVAIIKDEKPNNTDGGRFQDGQWFNRDLNVIEGNNANVILNLDNTFTVQPGSYFIQAFCPAYRVLEHQTRIYNNTDNQVISYGQSCFAPNRSRCTQSNSVVMGFITTTQPKILSIQHRSQTNRNNNGYGIANSFGNTQVYTIVSVFKIS